MTKSIAYLRADGGLSLCHPVISLDDPEGFSEQDALDRALAKDIPAGATSIKIVDRAGIPADRAARAAWFAAL